MLLRALRGKGLREIRGDLVLDRSFFAPAQGDPARFDGDALRPYNVLPDALLVHYKSLRFAFVPEPEREAVRIFVEPRPPGLEVANALRLSAGNCLEGRAFRDMLQARRSKRARRRAPRSPAATRSRAARRTSTSRCSRRTNRWRAMLRELWPELGGAWGGRCARARCRAEARCLHTHDSAPLAEIVRDVNKYSNNVMARQLYLTLATASSEPPARPELAARSRARTG